MTRKATRAAPGAATVRWLAVVAHELRGPLQPLRSFLSLVRLRGLADRDLLRCLDAAQRQLDHLERLVGDLSSMPPRSWAPERLLVGDVELKAVVEQALDSTRPLFAARGVAQTLLLEPGDCIVRGDRDRLMQVVLNLLSNAAKYTPPGGEVQVRLAREPAHCRLEVIDNGRGLADNERKRIFRPFTRGSAAAGSAGIGIGLSVVRRFVEQHGGTVDARSCGRGCGAVFTVQLPAAPQAAAAESRAYSP